MNAMDKAMDKTVRPAPPKPTERKKSPVNVQFEEKAKNLLRDSIKSKGVTIPELADRLAAIGVDISAGGVANKISRGGFSSAFLLQCMEALGLEVSPIERQR